MCGSNFTFGKRIFILFLLWTRVQLVGLRLGHVAFGLIIFNFDGLGLEFGLVTQGLKFVKVIQVPTLISNLTVGSKNLKGVRHIIKPRDTANIMHSNQTNTSKFHNLSVRMIEDSKFAKTAYILVTLLVFRNKILKLS